MSVFLTTYATREAWLNAAVDVLRPTFAAAGHILPDEIRVSTGWGYATRGESKYILAQAWATATTDDKVPSIFISPMLAKPEDVLAALVHELSHVADDCQHGHGAEYAAIAKAVGCDVSRPTQALPDVALSATLITFAEFLGDYPHTALHAPTDVMVVPTPDGGTRIIRMHSGPKKQGTRLLKAVCIHGGTANVRTTRGQVETNGFPYCGCHRRRMAWAG